VRGLEIRGVLEMAGSDVHCPFEELHQDPGAVLVAPLQIVQRQHQQVAVADPPQKLPQREEGLPAELLGVDILDHPAAGDRRHLAQHREDPRQGLGILVSLAGAVVVIVRGELSVLDVRRPGEHAGGHVPGAVNVPLSELERRLGELDPRRPTAVICQTGYRSSAAASLLRRAGFPEVFNVAGGTAAWIAAGHAVDTPLPAGTYDLQARIAGTDTVALDLPGVNLPEGAILTVVAEGFAGGAEPKLGVQVISYPAMAAPATLPVSGGETVANNSWVLLLAGAALVALGFGWRYARGNAR